MQLSPTSPTLIDILVPGRSLTKNIALIVGFSLLSNVQTTYNGFFFVTLMVCC